MLRLQWGRTREGAETVICNSTPFKSSACFNGAAPVKVRKLAVSNPASSILLKLQWGRTREGAETGRVALRRNG